MPHITAIFLSAMLTLSSPVLADGMADSLPAHSDEWWKRDTMYVVTEEDVRYAQHCREAMAWDFISFALAAMCSPELFRSEGSGNDGGSGGSSK